MRKITRRLGVTRLPKDGHRVIIKKILVCRPNHRLGNLLLLTPLLQEIKLTFPEAKVDLFLKGGVAPELFRKYDNIDRILLLPKKAQKHILQYLKCWLMITSSHYDLVVNVINNSSSGRLSAHFADAKIRLLGDVNDHIRASYPDHRHMAKFPVYSFRYYISMLGFDPSQRPVPPLDLKLTEPEISEGKRLLRDLLKNDGPTICIYTYATGRKCYPTTWWNSFYQLLREKFPRYNILEVLPIENVSQIAFHAATFYSKDLRQIGALIANAAIFIAADSGMMHLASASGAQVVGLFKADNIIEYAPYNNNSIGVHTDRTSQPEILKIVGNLVMTEVSQTRS